MTYEGWANYQTWNVSLWIANDEALYVEARHYVTAYMNEGNTKYADFVSEVMHGTWGDITPDGVSWTDPTLDHEALDTFLRQLAE